MGMRGRKAWRPQRENIPWSPRSYPPIWVRVPSATPPDARSGHPSGAHFFARRGRQERGVASLHAHHLGGEGDRTDDRYVVGRASPEPIARHIAAIGALQLIACLSLLARYSPGLHASLAVDFRDQPAYAAVHG